MRTRVVKAELQDEWGSAREAQEASRPPEPLPAQAVSEQFWELRAHPMAAAAALDERLEPEPA